MIEILKVIGRVILISFGLMSIAAGGLCTVLGSSDGMAAAWVAVIGIVALLIGGAVVWWTFRSWRGKPDSDISKEENQ
jgi:O-antigen/teichoic acid export membrane protein